MLNRLGFVLRTLTATVIGGMLLGPVSTLQNQCSADEPTIWKIEEDWELVVNEPEQNTNSPQVTFFMTPSATAGDTYFQLQMNYHADDDYSAGGFHVAAVCNDAYLDEARSQNQSLLTVDGDVIRWTSVMAVVNNKLMFAVKDGHCNAWGAFGGPAYLVEMPGHSIHDFSDYVYSQSSQSVDIGFGGNRVASVRLLKVRAFLSDGNVSTITVSEPPEGS